jgi:hypothetical protein
LVGCDVPLLAMLLLYLFSTGREPLEVKLRRQPNQPWTAFRILFVARPITENKWAIHHGGVRRRFRFL